MSKVRGIERFADAMSDCKAVTSLLVEGVVCPKRLLNQVVGKSLRTHNLKPKKGAKVMRKRVISLFYRNYYIGAFVWK